MMRPFKVCWYQLSVLSRGAFAVSIVNITGLPISTFRTFPCKTYLINYSSFHMLWHTVYAVQGKQVCLRTMFYLQLRTTTKTISSNILSTVVASPYTALSSRHIKLLVVTLGFTKDLWVAIHR